MAQILIIDDDALAPALRDALASDGHRCQLVPGLKQARLQLSLQPHDWVIAADHLADGHGLELMSELDISTTSLVLLCARPTVAAAVAAFRGGATDYLERPPDLRHLKALLSSRPSLAATVSSASLAKAEAARASGFLPGALLGESEAMRLLRDHIARVAPTEASVLLLGESGTGKELVAQNIHAQSARKRHPFLPVNCGAISPQLIESEIFGHEKGSFTGADRQHKGYFERASGGTLFLDEVVEMPIELQVKLLRVLETGSFMRIGSNQELHTDVRIVAATNREPEAAIAAGRLRLDLYHRLNVFPLKIPALR